MPRLDPSQNKVYEKRRYHAGPGLERRLKYKYGLTIAGRDLLLQRQGGMCAVCGMAISFGGRKRTSAAVDHCHVTGLVRGILCMCCNAGVGQFQDSPERCESAAAYLRKARS